MRLKRKLIILVTLILSLNQFFLYNPLFAARFSYYIKPLKVEKGKAMLIIFQNLSKKKEYTLKVSGKKVYKYRLQNIREYTLKLIGIPLNSPDQIRISLLENEREILEDWIRLYEIETKVSHVSVKKEYIVPKKSLEKRIQKEYKNKEKAKSVMTEDRYFSGAPVFPVTNGVPGTPFGYKRIYNKWKKSIHYGTDISAPRGTPIKSIFEGKIVLTGDLYYTGNTVIIDHGDGLITLYAHMDKIMAEQGQMVEKGEVIGTIGSTGRSTGPHLHLGAYINRIAVDPMSLFDVLKVK